MHQVGTLRRGLAPWIAALVLGVPQLSVGLDPDALESPRASLSAEEEVLDRFVDADVKSALESLPEHFRMPVLLADVEGFSYKEIAEMLEIPIGTVMSRLHRGRKALQKKLWSLAEARGLTEPAS